MVCRKCEGQGFLVVGGTEGIAPAVILRAAQRGAAVVFAVPPGGEGAAQQLQDQAAAAGHSNRVSFIAADLADEEAIEQFADAALERLPGLNVLIHNLESRAWREHRPLVDISLEEWNAVLGKELRVPFILARRVVEEYLCARVGGRIVYVAYSGSEPVPVSYATAQAGLRAFVRCVTKEFGRREVGCNAVVIHADDPRAYSAPGFALGEGGASGLVETVLFLASPESSFVNGETWHISSAWCAETAIDRGRGRTYVEG